MEHTTGQTHKHNTYVTHVAAVGMFFYHGALG